FNSVFNKISAKYGIKAGIIVICPDALLTLNIYFHDRPGILLISGTGSVCYGKDMYGQVFRTGGFGYLIEDSGSGFWFGKNALKAALRSFYGYGPKTVLESMVREYFSVKDLDQLPGYIYKENSKNKISSASRLVFEAAQTGCNTAETIIDKGADALALLVKDCSKMMTPAHWNLILHGSLFKQKILMSKMIQKLPEGTKISLSNKKTDLEAARVILKEFSQNGG
ncbi:MAG: BadF/BadG/BcrA/BcrD ATPase family protein, partial [Candidatus Delongbacteria bacterium]